MAQKKYRACIDYFNRGFSKAVDADSFEELFKKFGLNGYMFNNDFSIDDGYKEDKKFEVQEINFIEYTHNDETDEWERTGEMNLEECVEKWT